MYRSNEDVRIMECIVYFVDPKYPGSVGFLGGKERIRISIKTEHNIFDTFKLFQQHVDVENVMENF